MNTIQNILIIEDSDVEFDLICWGLQQIGVECPLILDKTAEEALERLTRLANDPQQASGLPEFILLDIKMPGMGGLGFLKKIGQAEAPLTAIPVIMLSSSSNPADITLSYQLGAAGFLRKPTTLDGYAEKMGEVMKLLFPS
ncbi:response regulator [Candidatus Woesearchaeota archaeon]|nr:response regulator [Candidatus Woesearchaeota archaeon]